MTKITKRQHEIIMALRDSGGAMNAKQLGERLGRTKQNIEWVIRSLARLGYMTKEQYPRGYKLTPRGKSESFEPVERTKSAKEIYAAYVERMRSEGKKIPLRGICLQRAMQKQKLDGPLWEQEQIDPECRTSRPIPFLHRWIEAKDFSLVPILGPRAVFDLAERM